MSLSIFKWTAFDKFGCSLTFLVLFVAGCGSLGSSKAVQQLQNENDRLLAEFRAQRDQNVQLSQRLNDAQARLAESEKMLARLAPLSPSQRLTRLNADSSASTTSSTSPRTPLSNLAPNSGAAALSNSDSGSDIPVDFQWRPMRKEPKR